MSKEFHYSVGVLAGAVSVAVAHPLGWSWVVVFISGAASVLVARGMYEWGQKSPSRKETQHD